MLILSNRMLSIVLGLALSLSVAQDVNLNGTVVDGSGQPIAGALVKLGKAGMEYTSDAKGLFTFTKGNVVHVNTESLVQGPFDLSPQGFTLDLRSFEKISLTVLTTTGKTHYHFEKGFELGVHNIRVPIFGNGVWIHRLRVGDKSYSFRRLSMNNNWLGGADFKKKSSEHGLTKSAAAVVDTITATHADYNQNSEFITTYISNGLVINLGSNVNQIMPDPNTEAVNTTKPMKVIILMGQSNMIGYGTVAGADQKGALEKLAKTDKRFPHTVDDAGDWSVRNDVWSINLISGKRKGWHTVGFGNGEKFIGPEYQIGNIMGDLYEEQVLIIKASIGNRALGWDLNPPSSRKFPEGVHPNKWYQGYEIDNYFAAIHGVLNNISGSFPDYKDQGYEIVGFGWFQGHKDQSTAASAAELGVNYPNSYEANMVNLIKDLRTEFKAPKAKYVCGTNGFEGWDMSGDGPLKVVNAQLAMNNYAKYPDHKGVAKTVETRGFWREVSESPASATSHYNHNAETYYLVGNAMGWAMHDLLK